MFTALSVFVVVFVITVMINRDTILKCDTSQNVGNFVAYIVIALVFGSFGGIIAMIPGEYLPLKYEHVEDIELVSVKDGLNVKGSFGLLGSGYINETMYYHFYVRGKNGGIKYERVKANYSRIVERLDEKPLLKVYKSKLRAEWQRKWFLHKSLPGYIFHVPIGSVTRETKFDLE